MRRVRFVLHVSLAVISAILLSNTPQAFAANFISGPLSEMQQQLGTLNSIVEAQQAQIDALKARRPDFNLQEYVSLAEGTKIFRATRFIKTSSFFLTPPSNSLQGTLTIQQYYEGEQLVQRWQEAYGDPNPNFPPVLPPNPFTAEFLYDVTPGGLVETGFRYYNPLGENSSTASYNPGLPTFPFGLYSVGDMWGGAYIERFRIVNQQDYSQRMSRLFTYAILGVETVTVPAGEFVDCIKIARYRGNSTDRVGWYAKGVGAVKFIFTSKDLTENNTLNGMYLLESME